MIQALRHRARKLAVIACAMFLVACAGTSATQTLTPAEVAQIKEGMTQEQVEQKLGPWQNRQTDKDGNALLRYLYESGSAWRGVFWVTIDKSTGKVIETATHAY
jgi:hypothetical protein